MRIAGFKQCKWIFLYLGVNDRTLREACSGSFQ